MSANGKKKIQKGENRESDEQMESKGKEKGKENRTAGTNGSSGNARRRFSGILRMLVPVLILSMVFCSSCRHVPGEHADPGGSSADPYEESRPEKDEP